MSDDRNCFSSKRCSTYWEEIGSLEGEELDDISPARLGAGRPPADYAKHWMRHALLPTRAFEEARLGCPELPATSARSFPSTWQRRRDPGSIKRHAAKSNDMTIAARTKDRGRRDLDSFLERACAWPDRQRGQSERIERVACSAEEFHGIGYLGPVRHRTKGDRILCRRHVQYRRLAVAKRRLSASRIAPSSTSARYVSASEEIQHRA